MDSSWQHRDVALAQAKLTDGEIEAFGKARALAYFVAAVENLPFEQFSMLDIGCGSGHYGRLIWNRYPTFVRYHGIDYSQAMIDVARSYDLPKEYITYEHRSLFDAELDNYDVILTSQTIEYLDDPLGALLWLLHNSVGKWVILHKLRWTTLLDGKPGTWIDEPTYCGNKERIWIWNGFSLLDILDLNGTYKTIDWGGSDHIFTAIMHKEKA